MTYKPLCYATSQGGRVYVLIVEDGEVTKTEVNPRQMLNMIEKFLPTLQQNLYFRDETHNPMKVDNEG